MNKYYLNNSQKQIWNNEITFKDSSINVISLNIHIDIDDISKVEAAVNKVMNNADVFKCKIISADKNIYFETTDDLINNCFVFDVMTTQEIKNYCSNLASIPFEKEELYHISIIPEKTGGVTVFCKFHHVIIDGCSMTLFAQYLLDTLEGKEIPKSNFFTEKDSENEVTDDSIYEEFWNNYFKDTDSRCEIYPETNEGIGKFELTKEIPASLNQSILNYCETRNLKPAYIYMAAYAIYLSRATQKKEVVISMSRLGREKEEFPKLGCYVVIIPVLIKIKKDDTLESIYYKLIKSADSSNKNRKYGFNNILRLCKNNNIDSNSLTAYVYSYFSHKITSKFNFNVELYSSSMYNNLTLGIVRKNTETFMQMDLHKEIYDVERGNDFIDSIETILEQAVTDKPVSNIDIISDKSNFTPEESIVFVEEDIDKFNN